MTVDPKWGFWLNVVGVVLLGLLGISWATVLPTKDAAVLMTILTAVYQFINTVLHGVSAPVPGPIAKYFNPTTGS